LMRLIQRSNVIQRQRYVPSHEFKDASRAFDLLLRLVFLRCTHGRGYEACDCRYGQSDMPMVPIFPGGKGSSLNARIKNPW
jgi:hypothetical protein